MTATKGRPAFDRRTLLKTGGGVLAAGIVAGCSSAPTPSATAAPLALAFTESGTTPIDALPEPVRTSLPDAMKEAVDLAKSSEWAFGATLVDVATGDIVAGAANDTASGDPSLHAEVHVLRKAGLAGVDLSSVVLVTTAESCPMCASCAVWAHVAGVAYGTPIHFLIDAGFDQIKIGQPQVVAAGFLPMPIVGGVLRESTDPLYASGPPSS